MTRLRAYFCAPRGTVSIGGGALSGLLPRSDTISAALVPIWSEITGGDASSAAEDPPYRLSSGLPWVAGRGDRRSILLPFPSELAPSRKRDPEPRLLWCEPELLTGAGPAAARHRGHDDRLLTSFAWAPPRDRRAAPGLVDTSERWLAVPAQGAAASLDRLSGRPAGGGLRPRVGWHPTGRGGFAIVAEISEEDEPTMSAALDLLGLCGLGAQRSTGGGAFRLVERRWIEEPDAGQGARLTLSAWLPTEKDVQDGALDGLHLILERGGWSTSAQGAAARRGSVRMLSEGALVPAAVDPRPGKVVRVASARAWPGLSHDVWRDGRCLTVAVPGRLLEEALG